MAPGFWVEYIKMFTITPHSGRLVRLARLPSSVRGLTFDIKRHPFSLPPSSLNNTHSQCSKIKLSPISCLPPLVVRTTQFEKDCNTSKWLRSGQETTTLPLHAE